MSQRLFIFGLGYSGLEIARLAKQRGWAVQGSVTTTAKAARLQAEGIDTLVFDGTQALAVEASHVLCTASTLLLPSTVRAEWLGYLSTTGVYGNRDGGWVDETMAATPTQPRSRERVETEKAWQASAAALGLPLAIFRLPGIYGPGRSPLDNVRSGNLRRIDKPGQYFSRIHVADIANAVLAAAARKAAGIFNVADDEPAPNADVVAYACTLLGVPVPPAVPWEQAAPGMTPMARSFYSESRRVRNDKMKRELGVTLAYPTYREGLRAVL